MKKILKISLALMIVIIASLLFQNQAKAQVPGYAYTYDDSGNRLTRTYTLVLLRKGDTTETKSLLGEYNITLCPNPTQGLLVVKIPNLKSDAAINVIVTDFSGASLFNSVFKGTENQIDLSKYVNSTYFMTISIGEKTETFKILKME